MVIKYVSERPDVPIPCEPNEDGIYLLRVDGELTVAEWCASDWYQIGTDYDVWQYGQGDHKIEVVKKLDLEALAREA